LVVERGSQGVDARQPVSNAELRRFRDVDAEILTQSQPSAGRPDFADLDGPARHAHLAVQGDLPGGLGRRLVPHIAGREGALPRDRGLGGDIGPIERHNQAQRYENEAGDEPYHPGRLLPSRPPAPVLDRAQWTSRAATNTHEPTAAAYRNHSRWPTRAPRKSR